jgi:hypothetical protein
MNIINALLMIPEMIVSLNKLAELLHKVFGEDPKKFMLDLHEATEAFKTADTQEKKLDALRDIQKLIHRL